MHPGQILEQLRKAEGVSQTALAKQLDVARQYLWAIENGKKEPGLVFLRAAAGHFRVPVAMFLIDDSDPDAPLIRDLQRMLMHVLKEKHRRGRR